jgi:photosystem II stability/assembly factor-like uncharacterized protein
MQRPVHMTALTTLLVVCLLSACSAARPIANATPSGGSAQVATAQPRGSCVPGSRTESLVTFGGLKMIDATYGWAVGQCGPPAPRFPQGSTLQCYWPTTLFSGILRTADGAKTWTDVSPPSIPNRSFQHAEFFLDATHAWVGEVSSTASACVSAVTVFITDDGGSTWKQGGTIPIKSEAPTSGLFDIPGPTHAMNFTDAQHGWLLADATAANPQPPAMVDPTNVYRTVDGGLHWTLAANDPGRSLLAGAPGCDPGIYQPASDPLFVSPMQGWLALACTQNFGLLRTDDGGSTWTLKTLTCGCQVWQPQFFDTSHAVITGTQGSPVMIVTGDGGATWQQKPVPVAAQTYFSFTDPEHGWMVGIAQLPNSYKTVVYRTVNGGASWSSLGNPTFATQTPRPNLYYPIQDVQFVDAQTGFVTLGPEEGGQGVVAEPSAPELQIVKTSDGGQTWMSVLSQLPATPCINQNLPPGGPAAGEVMPARMASTTIGWAQGGLRTEDGGLHWRDRSAPDLRGGMNTLLYPAGYTEFFLDGDHAWQAGVYPSKTSCGDHVTTFSTTDGGKTWHDSAPIPLNLPAGQQVVNTQMGFTSPSDGWLLVPRDQKTTDPGYLSYTEADVFATTDGGNSWRHLSRIGASQLQTVAGAADQSCQARRQPIEFSSPSVGWISVGCGASTLLVTKDGGVTWKAVDLRIPSAAVCPCWFGLPTFFDSAHGLVVASGSSGISLMLTTVDGGATWQPAGQPGTGPLMVAWLDPTDLFSLSVPPGWSKGSANNPPFEMYRSSDAGQTWKRVSNTVPAAYPPGFFQFIDSKHGFEAGLNADNRLLTTSDGGATWKSITTLLVS